MSMAQNGNREENERLPALPSDGKALIEQAIEKVFDAGPDKALQEVEILIQTLDTSAPDSAFAALQIALQSMWQFFRAINLIQSEANYVEARTLFQAAADGF